MEEFAHNKKLDQKSANFHEGEKHHKHESCGKSSGAESLKRQIHTVHERQKDHKCEHCGKFLTSVQYLKKHIYTIHNS